MENLSFDKILTKKEQKIISEKQFFEKYPEFLEAIGPLTKQEGNRLVYENEKMSLTVSTQEISQDQIDIENNPELHEFLWEAREHFSLGDHVQLTEFELKSGDFEYGLSQETKKPLILVRRVPSSNIVEGYAYNKANMVVLNSIPTSPDSILTMAHELGHINDDKVMIENSIMFDQKLKAVMAGGRTAEMDKERDALTLRQERFAWAYALNKLRPFISAMNISNEGVNELVHNFTMGSHCTAMAKNYED